MKHRWVIGLVVGGLLLIVFWLYPQWFSEKQGERRFVRLPSCRPGQLTTLKNHDGGSTTPVAVNESTALQIFEKPVGLLEKRPEDYWARRVAEIARRAEEFLKLVEQGQVVRVPKQKLVRAIARSQIGPHIVEVEVFRRGRSPLRGFVYWEDLGCFSLE